MTTTATPQVSSRARASAIGWGSDPHGPSRRHRGRIAAAIVLMVVCGWLAAVVFLSVGHRKEVVALAHPVSRFHQLTRADLRTVRVASDPSVSVVAANQLDGLVGSVAATDLTTGSLLSPKQLLAKEKRPVADGDAVVGTLLASADSPDVMPIGARVEVIVRPETGGAVESRAQTIRGWILTVAKADQATGGRKVSLVVPSHDAGLVSAAASEKRVSVVVLGGS